MMINNQEKQHFYFSKSQRLLKAIDFKTVFDNPSFKVHQTNLLFFVKMHESVSELSGNMEDSCRLGLAITKKKIKRANERNRLKRLIREQFRLHQYQFNHIFDVVVIVKVGTQSLSNQEIFRQIDTGFQQIIHKANQFCLNKTS